MSTSVPDRRPSASVIFGPTHVASSNFGPREEIAIGRPNEFVVARPDAFLVGLLAEVVVGSPDVIVVGSLQEIAERGPPGRARVALSTMAAAATQAEPEPVGHADVAAYDKMGTLSVHNGLQDDVAGGDDHAERSMHRGVSGAADRIPVAWLD